MAEHPQLGATLADFEVLLTGGGSRQQGLVAFLNENSELRFKLWGDEPKAQIEDATQFAVAFGTVLHAFGLAAQATSLLPPEIRVAARSRQTLFTLQVVGLSLLVITALVLAAGTWQKLSLISRKEALLTQAESAVDAAGRTDVFNRQIVAEYQHLQPVLELERYALDTLEALNAIQHVRTNRSLWFVLFADQSTYFTASLPSETNSVSLNDMSFAATNIPLARRGAN
jgi:hypothetical protein